MASLMTKISIIALSLTMLPSYGKTLNDPNLTCPPVNMIQKYSTEVNQIYNNGMYYIVSSQPVISYQNHAWAIYVYNIKENSPEDIIKSAQNIANTVQYRKNIRVDRIPGSYVCHYGPNEVSAISAP